MPEIDLDADIFEYLQSQAEPFVDTPNTVLRRLLDLEQASSDAPEIAKPKRHRARPNSPGKRTIRSRSARVRAATGTLLPEDRYELPLLRALVAADGRAPYRELVDAVGIELKDALLPADFETLDSGTIRWQSRLQFVRLRLIERGLLEKDMPRGVWGITDAGREAVNVEGEG